MTHEPAMEEQLKPLLDDLFVLMEVGRIYYLRDEYEKAEKVFRGVIAIAPEATNAIYAAGIACYCQKKYHPALELLDQALALKPDMDLARAARAKVYLALGRQQEAIDDFKKIETPVEGVPGIPEHAKGLLQALEHAESPRSAPEDPTGDP